MPLPLPTPDTTLVRFKLVVAGVSVPVNPTLSSDLALSREPADDNPAGSFYYRDKLTGTPLKFAGSDFKLLYAIETSTDRCQRIGLLVEHRAYPGATWEVWRGEFTCNDCTDWNAANCTVGVTPILFDPYTRFLENYDREWNILATPLVRHTVSAQLATLAGDTKIEFKLINRDEQGDYLGTDGWALFWDNQSFIYKNYLSSFEQEVTVVIFRYRQRNYSLGDPVENSSPPVYVIADRSDSGWTPLFPSGVAQGDSTVNTPTLDYVKEPGIAGFKAYKLTGSGSGTPFLRTAQLGAVDRGIYHYGTGEFLSLDCGKTPADVGLNNDDWVPVTGPDEYGANSDESPGGACINARESLGDENFHAIYYRFGNFRFDRAFPLIDGLYSLISQTAASYGGQSLLPPYDQRGLLSEFLTADVNPATGDSGLANEVPRLLLSAGCDIKRFGSSDAATRLLISLKQFLSDLSALYDAGWFIDPATGWLRFEHRAYLETRQGAGAVVDLQTLEDALLSASYSYRVQSLPRYEELSVAAASTENEADFAYYDKSSIDYGPGGCTNQKQGSNKLSVSSARLTGDVPAGILNGESIPDSALFLLAPDLQGRLPNANREVSCSQLQLRYWRRGRAAGTATVEGPAPPVPANTPVGALPVYGQPLYVQSIRPQRVQADISGKLPLLATLAADARYTTNLGTAGQLGKADLLLSGLNARKVSVTIWLTVPFTATPPPAIGRQFDDSFDLSFD